MIQKKDLLMIRYNIEKEESWRTWVNKMPYLRFDSDWEVKVIPPFAGALVRFVVVKGEKKVSVYFDVDCRLGCMADDKGNPIPYFEIYPYAYDVKRYKLDETEQMISDIRKVLNGDDTPCNDGESL